MGGPNISKTSMEHEQENNKSCMSLRLSKILCKCLQPNNQELSNGIEYMHTNEVIEIVEDYLKKLRM